MNITSVARAHERNRRFVVATLLGILAAWPIAALAQAPVRLSDQQVKQLIDQIYDDRDKFEGNLDDSIKNRMMKTATTDASVKAVLQDLQDNSNKLKERFTKDYPAGAEAETVLKQATMINAAMERV